VDCGDEEEAQAEPLAAVSITVSDDFETFQHGDDVLARHALAGNGAVFFLVACG